ncbi:MAG TPA: sugar-transfer associated ATP-grasp domain-containing protein [Gemmatimonadaceae bacterium]|nr:sugar-transfer associated ATP-grasp domain-containing protein [Gemmatimonadaceae bacterium]
MSIPTATATPDPPGYEAAATPTRRAVAERSMGGKPRLSLRLWHRLLTPGRLRPTPAARLRGWARVLEWREADTAGRLRLVKRAVWTPVRAWKEAREEVARSGADVEAVTGLSPRTQHRQLCWLGARHALVTGSYLDYQLFRPERRRRAAEYLQEAEFFRVAHWLQRAVPNRDGYPILDKPAFEQWCRRHGLAVVPTLLEYHNGELVTSMLGDAPAAALPRCDLFSKPSDGTGGHGTARWRYVGERDGEPAWMGGDGALRSADALLGEIARVSRTLPHKYGIASNRILVQPCLRNHRDLLPLTPGGLCTVRVLTYRHPGGEPRVALASYKMPVGDAPADNFCYGGIIAPVDLATGRLGEAIRRRGAVPVPIERHPDTGTVIAGHQLPLWSETLTLARRALEAGFERPTIGWDIAITDDGPVLVEGNTKSNPDVAQAPSGVPLSATPFPAAIDAYMRLVM